MLVLGLDADWLAELVELLLEALVLFVEEFDSGSLSSKAYMPITSMALIRIPPTIFGVELLNDLFMITIIITKS